MSGRVGTCEEWSVQGTEVCIAAIPESLESAAGNGLGKDFPNRQIPCQPQVKPVQSLCRIAGNCIWAEQRIEFDQRRMCCSDRDRKSNQESTGTSHDRLQFRSHATVTTPAYHVMLHRRCAVYPDRVQTLP